MIISFSPYTGVSNGYLYEGGFILDSNRTIYEYVGTGIGAVLAVAVTTGRAVEFFIDGVGPSGETLITQAALAL